MAKRILAATEMRQNLREILDNLEDHQEPYYITQRSRPIAVLAKYDEYETLAAQAKEAEQLKSALRWTLGFIANISAAMEIQDEPAKYIHLLETGIRQGLKRSSVPKGVLTSLDDVAEIIKEWDYKTFRLHQDARVLERTEKGVVLGRSSCPYLLNVMRRHASFHIKRIGWRDYRGASKGSAPDFLCLCCGLCCGTLVDWLSDGKMMVQEIPKASINKWKDTCAYVIRNKVSESSG